MIYANYLIREGVKSFLFTHKILLPARLGEILSHLSILPTCCFCLTFWSPSIRVLSIYLNNNILVYFFVLFSIFMMLMNCKTMRSKICIIYISFVAPFLRYTRHFSKPVGKIVTMFHLLWLKNVATIIVTTFFDWKR